MKDFVICLVIWNIIVFFTYGADKLKAKKRMRRISEQTLITIAFLFGSIGALSGMYIFRHKTRHLKFRILLPLALIVNAVLLLSAQNYIF